MSESPKTVIADDLVVWVINGEKLMFENKAKLRQKKKEQAKSNFDDIPGFDLISDAFDVMFKTPISTMFYYANRDYYSKFAKISTFVLLVLIPSFILLFIGGI